MLCSRVAVCTLLRLFLAVFLVSGVDDYENLTGGGRVLCDGRGNGSYLVSSNRRFELGFFSPKESRDRYLGVWFKNLPLTVVWIANRRQPFRNKNGCLRFVEGIGLGLFSGKKRIWVVRFGVKNPTLELLGSGNLVVKNGSLNNGEYVWESFDHPCDTLLPGMKLGWDMRRGVYRKLSSWRAVNDPNLGEFEFGLDLPQSPQLVLWKDMVKVYRWGPWSRGRFSGTNEWRNTILLKTYRWIK